METPDTNPGATATDSNPIWIRKTEDGSSTIEIMQCIFFLFFFFFFETFLQI